MSDFRINKAYAERYNSWRHREELQKLKDKYGDVDKLEDSESSSSESEDEDAEELTAQVETEWLKALAAIKRDDPRIYNKDVKFFIEKDEEEEENEEKSKTKKQKSMFLKDYERKVILEKEGHISSDSEESDENEEVLSHKPGYYEEQEEIKKSFKSAMSDSSDDSSDSELLTQRQKTSKEQEEEEGEYFEWLKGHKNELETSSKTELGSLKEYWNDPELEDGERFLRDYILNKGYLDKDADRIPTYDEIVNEQENIEEEEEMLEKQEEFERKYNFRFEEPDEEFIKTYPRTIKNSVRQKDNKRAEKREEVRERKKREKEKKQEEIKQLKNLKKQEILNKIEKLKEITGNPTLGFDEDDINDDFDPKKHDEMMQKAFNEDYYGVDEDQKPVFDDEDYDEDIKPENWDTWEGGHEEGGETSGNYEEEEEEDLYCEDPGFIMDADYDPTQVVTKKKKNKKSKFAKAITRPKPVFDPKEKTFEEYFDEYYKLDYEDIIDDMPCRFKYRKVVPNDFGLSVDEIIHSKDKELNQWVSLKKMSQYRTKEDEEMDVRIYTQKGRNKKKKYNILTALKEKEEEEEEKQKVQQEKKAESRRKKRNKKKLKKTEGLGSDSSSQPSQPQKRKLETVSGSVNKVRKLTLDLDMDDEDNESVEEQSASDGAGHSHTSDNKQKKMITDESVQSPKGKMTVDSENNFDSEQSDKTGNSDSIKKKKKVKAMSDKMDKATNSKKKKKHWKPGMKPILTDERLLAYGIQPKKYKYMKFKKGVGEENFEDQW